MNAKLEKLSIEWTIAEGGLVFLASLVLVFFSLGLFLRQRAHCTLLLPLPLLSRRNLNDPDPAFCVP